MNADAIVVEQTYHAPVPLVWDAITDPDQMRLWFFAPMKDFEPRVGFETGFDIHHEGNCYPHRWKITYVEPEVRIVYDWRYEGYPGSSVVTWELEPVDSGTRLRLTHSGAESFPQDNPVFSRESGLEGWRYFLCETLKAFLDERMGSMSDDR